MSNVKRRQETIRRAGAQVRSGSVWLRTSGSAAPKDVTKTRTAGAASKSRKKP